MKIFQVIATKNVNRDTNNIYRNCKDFVLAKFTYHKDAKKFIKHYYGKHRTFNGYFDFRIKAMEE